MTNITGIDFTDHDESSSLFDPNYTYSNDKYSCIREFYFAHIVFNFLVFLAGIGCMITRVVPARYKWIHSWLGRTYILCMLWSTVTSLLMNNTGLPLTTIISFGAVMGGLTVGWIAILIHKQQMEKAAAKLVNERLLQRLSKGSDGSDDEGTTDVVQMLNQAKGEVADSKTFVQRFFSLKALHGIVFFVSWMQIAGRIFASNLSGDFTCHTYPVYKPINTPEGDYANTGNLTLVPVNDPDWDTLPWANGAVAWSLQIILGSMFGAAFVGAVWCWCAVRKARKAQTIDEKSERRETAMVTAHDSKDVSSDSDHDEGFVDEEKAAKEAGGEAVKEESASVQVQ